MSLLLVLKMFLLVKGGQYFLLLKGWQCLRKYAPPFITKILLHCNHLLYNNVLECPKKGEKKVEKKIVERS